MITSKVRTRISKLNKRCFYQNTNDYQYWQKSKIPSMHFQPSLPRLPIPKLEDTCTRYLRAQKPLLTDEAFEKTQGYVKQFENFRGKELHEQLLAKNKKNKRSSYISDPWFDMYLSDRKPLPLNYNPTLVHVDDDRPSYNKQLLKTANLVISSLRFYKSLLAGILEPEVYHMNPKKTDNKLFRSVCSKVPSVLSWYSSYLLFNAYPLDMSQYASLFSTTRIPEIGKDRLYHAEGARHILVQYKGNFFIVNVLDESFNILPPENIFGSIKYILENTKVPCEFPVGVLTTLNRDEWAKIRNNLINLGNEDTIRMIDSALFNICLDDNEYAEDTKVICKEFLHSDGKNRWFDKSLSVIVSKYGKAGINFEHSWGDGVAVLRYFQDIYKDVKENAYIHPDTKPYIDQTCVRNLDFKLDDNIKNTIVETSKAYENKCKSLNFDFIEMENYGKNFCKKHLLSPDAVMQLGFQAAYYKLRGTFVGSYESCSTSAFRHGRTETIRPCTTATKNYCLAINKSSNKELLQMIKECSKTHGQLTKEAAMGQGFDRHLFALKLLASDTIDLYEDPAYKFINYNIISTSTLSSSVIGLGAFGPVVKDGFGIGYSIWDNNLGTLVTSYQGQADGAGFVSALEKSYQEIFSILKDSK
ncbi:hypothetical protein FQR65_LT00998 [Abscondita terminalis]|nr:hypothetical protein FQR65_LT00998 [Abscondita terminalis]